MLKHIDTTLSKNSSSANFLFALVFKKRYLLEQKTVKNIAKKYGPVLGFLLNPR